MDSPNRSSKALSRSASLSVPSTAAPLLPGRLLAGAKYKNGRTCPSSPSRQTSGASAPLSRADDHPACRLLPFRVGLHTLHIPQGHVDHPSLPRVHGVQGDPLARLQNPAGLPPGQPLEHFGPARSEEHTSELQSRENLVCRLLLEKKK